MLCPLFLLTLLKHLHSLAIFSFFAQVSNVFAFGVVFWFDFEHYKNVQHYKRFHPKELSLQGLPFFFAVSIYCFEGAGMILSVEKSLLPEVRSKFNRYFVSTLSCITFLYLVFGVGGYLSFGTETKEIITLNLPKGSGYLDFPKFVTFCLCLSLFFCYPVMMFPVSAMLQDKWFCGKGEIIQRISLRICLVTCTGLVVTCVPNFSHLMALVGATCCTLLSFILPGLFHLRLNRGSLRLSEKALDLFLIVMGAIGSVWCNAYVGNGSSNCSYYIFS